jgi:hypothetical protein
LGNEMSVEGECISCAEEEGNRASTLERIKYMR